MLDRLEAEAARSGPGKALRLQRTRGRALVAAGNVDAGIEMMEAARTGARVQGNVVYEWQISADLAHAHLVRGDRDQSRTAANEAIDLIDELASRVDDDDLRRNFLEKAMELLPGTMRRRIASSPSGLLSAREQEVAGLVSQGLTSREIADRLVLSSRTVESHVGNAMAKLGFTTRSQLAAWAAEHRATHHS
jgi:DNA-binding CsgD family transcriptional regulator